MLEVIGTDAGGLAGLAPRSLGLVRQAQLLMAPARLLGELPDEVILRIDSMGEDEDVERALIGRGEAAARAEGAPAIGPARSRSCAAPRTCGSSRGCGR